MSERKTLAIFGATGNQGGSVIDTVLANPELQQKYSLRGITRDPQSSKSQALASKGVKMVSGDLNDEASLRAAVKGAYGVFGVTDFWSLMDKEKEIQQGKNIFAAAQAENVSHLVWSTLPYAEKLTKGVLKHVSHFDSKAQVAEFIDANKGANMTVSYFMPAMFINFAKQMVNVHAGTPTLSLPFPSDSIQWPLIDPRRDSGKYVMGLFEGGRGADGVRVHGVSTWTTPKEVVAALSNESQRNVVFNPIPAEVFASFLPPAVSKELTETLLLIGDYSYYGPGEEKNQSTHDKWLIGGSTISYEQWVKENAPWTFE